MEHEHTDHGGQEYLWHPFISIAVEALSGFGRNGRMLMILAKVLTGRYVPLAITLLTEQMFSTFAASRQALQAVGAAIAEVCVDQMPA